MPIKFGDTLENQNTNFPIVDVVGDNIAGVHIVSDFTNGQLTAIPSNARRQGSIVIAQDDGTVFVYKSSDTADGNGSDNKWGHPAGTAWVAVGTTADGSIQLGSSVTLNDNTVAVSIDSNTTVISAIDQLNETLGLLVPTAPKTLATQINGGVEFAASSFGAFVTFSSNRLVSNPVTNSLTGIGSTGDAVDHTTDTNISSKTVIVAPSNDCAVEEAKIQLSGSQSVTTTLASGSSTATTSSLTLSKTTGGFPDDGSSSAGFHTGVNTFSYEYAGTLGDGAHKITFGDTDLSPAVTKVFFVQPISSPSAISASSAVLDTSSMNEDTGHTYYYSSGVKYCGDTNFSFGITATVANIVPSGVSVYGATLNTASDYNFAQGNARACFAAPPTLDYTAHQSVSSNTNVAAGLANFSLSQNVSLRANNGTFTIGTTDKPRYDFKSMYGNDNNVDFAGTAKTLLAWNSRTSDSSTMVPFEEELFSSINGDGVRVKETTTDSYTTTPGGTENLFAAWSPQFGNNASGSFAINAKDAIVTPDGIKHDDETNFSTADYPASQATATNFSNRNTDAQFITWKVPLNTSNPAQKLKITVTGTFTEFRVKQFDTGSTPSTLDDNPSTNGWLDCMAPFATQSDNGVPVGGCGDGASFDGSESNTTLTITAGQGRWGNGSHLYVRIKLSNGEAITKLGLQPNA